MIISEFAWKGQMDLVNQDFLQFSTKSFSAFNFHSHFKKNFFFSVITHL